MSRIYLDYNASAPLHPAARAAMLAVLDLPANAHSAHAAGQLAFQHVEDSRRRLATRWGIRPDRIVFTSGATEANALALRGGQWSISAVEHPSVRTWGRKEIPVDAAGRVTEFGAGDVAVMLANNETGVIQPIAEVLSIVHARGDRTHIDATQGPGRMALPAALWQAESIAFSGHKCGGPQGVGVLVLAAHPRSQAAHPGRETPLNIGRAGPQERGRRAGTLNIAGILGMVAALEAVGDGPGPALREALEAGIRTLGGRVLSDGASRIDNTTCAVFPGWDAVDLVIALDLEGVAVSAGAACASGSTERSHVLTAMGEPGTAVRFSTGWGTTEAEVDRALFALAGVLKRRP